METCDYCGVQAMNVCNICHKNLCYECERNHFGNSCEHQKQRDVNMLDSRDWILEFSFLAFRIVVIGGGLILLGYLLGMRCESGKSLIRKYENGLYFWGCEEIVKGNSKTISHNR